MIRNRFLVRMCGVGLIALLSPLAAMGQTTGGTTGGTTTGGTSSVATPGTGLASGVGNSSAQGVSAAIGSGLTQKLSVYAASSGVGTATSIPSNANPFANNYVLPSSLGLPSLYQTQYGAQNVISTSGGPKGKFTYLYVAPPTAATTTQTTTTTTSNFTTYAQLRNPVYSTYLSDDLPIVQHKTTDLHARVREAIERSSRLENKDNIRINLDGDTIVLSGTVRSERERSVAEGLARMTPGVNGVPLRNDITVVPVKN